MAGQMNKAKGKDLLVRKMPLWLHFKIDRHMESTGLTKRDALIDLVTKATKHINIIEPAKA